MLETQVSHVESLIKTGEQKVSVFWFNTCKYLKLIKALLCLTLDHAN